VGEVIRIRAGKGSAIDLFYGDWYFSRTGQVKNERVNSFGER